MKFLLVFILTIQTVNSSSVEFNEYLKALQSQFKVISLSEESLTDIENELKKDFQFMSSKPYWKSFSDRSNPNHFLTWLTEKTVQTNMEICQSICETRFSANF